MKKFFFSIFLSFVLVFNSFADKISFPIMGLMTPLPYPVYIQTDFDANWFGEDPFTYHHGLARIACVLSDVSYVDARKPDNALVGCYKALGIKEEDIMIDYSPIYSKEDNDTAAFSFAIFRGFREIVVIAVIRGTPLNANEWISNLNIADSTKQEEIFHEGFKKATERIFPKLQEFIHQKNINIQQARFLVTGHSRGAAIANLLAAQMSIAQDFSSKKIFAYTFATPNVTTSSISDDERFGNIWNIESEEDIVQSIPPERGNWHFHKFGKVKMLPSRWKFNAQEYSLKKEKMDSIFKQIMQRNYEPFQIGAFVPIQIARFLTKMNKNVESYYGFLGIRKVDWIFWKIFPENPSKNKSEKKDKKDKKSDDENEGKYAKIAKKFIDMHSCETYLSWLLALEEEELFSNNGSIEIRISGSADCAILDNESRILAKVNNGYVKYDSVYSPVGAMSYPNRTFIGLPEIEDFRIVVQKESIIPTPINISINKYDERGILIEKTDSLKKWFHAGSAIEFASGKTIEAKESSPEKSLRLGWKPYFSPEIEFAPTKELSFGINAGTRHIHAVFLIAPPIVKDLTRLSVGIATEFNVWTRFYADIASLWTFSWEDEFKQFPAARITLSYRPIRRAELFGAFRLNFENITKDMSLEKRFSFGFRF